MSDNTSPDAVHTLSKKDNNTIKVEHESAEAWFCTGSQEIIFLTTQAAANLDRHAGEMMTVVDGFTQAKALYSEAIQEYGVLNSQISESAGLAVKEAEIARKENILAEKREALQEILGEFESSGAGYEDIVELIPIRERTNKGSRSRKGKRYAYAKKGYIDKLGTGVKHRVKFKESPGESIFIRDKKNNINKIATAKLKKQLTTLRTNNESAKFFSKDDICDIDKTLTGWAESWNNSLVLNEELGQHVDVSAGAQFMRFACNMGASGGWDPQKGELAFKAEAQARLSLASGTAKGTFYIPDRIGWSLSYQLENQPKPLNMGMLRCYFSTSLIGFAGASAQLEAQLQVKTLNGKQLITGDRQARLPRFSERRTTGATFHNAREQSAEDKDGLSASGEIFGGARGEMKMSGGIQWLQPPDLTTWQGKTGKDAKKAGQFVDFCSFSESLVGMAGAGIGGAFQCDFINGRFCFKIAASLCLGVGAKGSLEAAVDYDKLKDFGGWLIYQLYSLDYTFFDVVTPWAFTAFTQVSVMLLSDFKVSIEYGMRACIESVQTLDDIYSKFINTIDSGIDASKKRNLIASNILSTPGFLLSCTPESKGILLYILTRHGIMDHFDRDNRGDEFIPDIYGSRKAAILVILHSIQTQREWFQVLSRINANGEDLAGGNSALKYMVAQNKMNELRRYLQEGRDRDNEMDNIYRALKIKPCIGYALAMNNTWAYRLAQADNPFYTRMATFSPLSLNSSNSKDNI
ncbi:ATPase [Erwinia sorbitola]|uniref:ATPase n=1 Tax=Erwinia sorbitola TaxID=2681984 RepID=A0A6I6EH27_9GAMM|nr:ATPase [Erwinia sorbitola]QGU89187.1 ATPase [Erwinia sorbitola]